MRITCEKWKEILSQVEKSLSRSDTIEEVKKHLKVEDKDEYEKWRETGFNVDHLFMVPFLSGNAFIGTKHTLLHLAAEHGCTNVVKALIEAGPDVNKLNEDRGNTSLGSAAKNGYMGIVNALVGAGADVNKANCFGCTPIHYAAKNGHLEIVKYLIKNGADVNKENGVWETPLHESSKNGHVGVVKVLIKSGARLDEVNKKGRTPLYEAAKNGHVRVVNALIEMGADFNKGAPYGSNSLQYLINHEIGVAQVLIEAIVGMNKPKPQCLQNSGLAGYWDRCVEKKKMKEDKPRGCNLSFYDVVFSPVEKMTMSRAESIIERIESNSNYNGGGYPIHGGLICERLDQAKKRKGVLRKCVYSDPNKCEDSLWQKCKERLGTDFIETNMIAKIGLSNGELCNAHKPKKRQHEFEPETILENCNMQFILSQESHVR